MNRIAVRAILASAFIGILAGCGGAKVSSPHPVNSDPFQGFGESTLSEEYSREAAIESVSRPCMESKGFAFISVLENVNNWQPEEHYGSFDSKTAATQGYHVPTDKTLRVPEPSQEYVAALYGEEDSTKTQPIFDANRNVISETTVDGCMGKALVAVFGNFGERESLRRIFESASNDSLARAMATDQWRAVIKKWSNCMADDGYHFDNFGDPMNIYSSRGEKPSSEEIKVAITDAACRASMKTSDRLRKIDWSYRAEFAEQHPDLVSRYVAVRTATAKRIASLIGTAEIPAK